MECPMIIDTHAHLRIGAMLHAVVAIIIRYCQAAVIEPNVHLPGFEDYGVRTAAQARFYRDLIKALATAAGYPNFRPKMAILLADDTDADDVPFWRDADVVTGKGYPDGLYAHGGVSDYRNLDKVLRAMYEYDIPVSWHFERPRFHPLLAEQAAIEDFRWFADRGDVRVVHTHASSAMALKAVWEYYPHAIAEVTPQHLWMTQDDVYDSTRTKIVYPHSWCRPPAKTAADREACIEAAIEWAMGGSDFAPHPEWSDQIPSKKSDPPAAGCANYPAGPSVVAKTFADRGALNRLREFLADRASDWYGIELDGSSLVIENTSWVVDEEITVSPSQILVPWLAGVTLPWQVVAA